jgi:hypothetical protein
MDPPGDKLLLIDAIGPFFRDYKKVRINWSKIPWRRIQKLGPKGRRAFFDRVKIDLRTFCERVAAIGCNAVSLDDLPHLADHELYEAEVREQIAANRRNFRELFDVVRDSGLKIFLTMDVMTFTPGLEEKIRGGEAAIQQFAVDLLEKFFADFSEVEGVILRIGESDGHDVKELFRSRLVLKSPAMVNRFLKAILPVFEKHQRTCVFRTWTVGAHRVGDLIWREATLTRTVQGIESPALVLSMKYGESDFFRYLSLNRNLFVTDLPTIIELQARREYEGCGEYPSFIGHDYEKFALEIRGAPNFAGISLWCQTGGWTPFRRLAFLDESAIWTEINAFVTLRLFHHGELWEEAVRQLPQFREYPAAGIELLRLSEEVVKELLYVPEFARQKMFFRRVRVPTLVGVYWHNIFIAHAIKRMLGHFVEDGEASIRTGYAAMEKIRHMHSLAEKCGLPTEDIEFMEATFSILALAREYFFRPFDEEIQTRLMAAKKAYKKKYPRGTRYRYAIKINLSPFRMKARHVAWFTKYLLRDQPGYRFIDRIIGLRLLSFSYRVLKRARPKMIPGFARKSAMGIDAIFK